MIRGKVAGLRWAKLAVVLVESTTVELVVAMTALQDWTLGCKPLEWAEAERQCLLWWKRLGDWHSRSQPTHS
jgi:hypothetical protein